MENKMKGENMDFATMIEILIADGANDKFQMIDALKDGAYLSKKGWSQDDVESLYEFLQIANF